MIVEHTAQQTRQVLLLGSTARQDKQDMKVRQSLLKHAELSEARSLCDLEDALRRQDYDAFFCAWKVDGGMWEDALQQVQKQAADLPLIVITSAGKDRQRIGALEKGAFDVLVPPYKDCTILYLLEHASVSHQARSLHSKTSSATTFTPVSCLPKGGGRSH